jgi:hypothetical protein
MFYGCLSINNYEPNRAINIPSVSSYGLCLKMFDDTQIPESTPSGGQAVLVKRS